MSQLLTMIIFAVAALVVLYQLYAVLGRRVGRQPEDVAEAARKQAETAPAIDETDEPPLPGEPVVLTGLAALRARDPSFDMTKFVNGARSAYEMIVEAFAEGDRETLEDLVGPSVRKSFEQVMDQNAAAGVTQQVEFLHPPRGDVEDVTVDGDKARIRVRFLAEQRVRSTSPEGDAVDDRRTAEVWTFERNLKNRDPNWLLVRVDAAEV